MDKVTSLVGISDGILMPQMMHQWQVKFTGQNIPFTDEQQHIFVTQMVACSMDYHLKTLTLNVQQDRFTSELHDMVKQFSIFSKTTAATNKVSFIVDMLDGSYTVLKSFSFVGCILIAHSFELDYANSDAAQHKIKFSYKTTKEI